MVFLLLLSYSLTPSAQSSALSWRGRVRRKDAPPSLRLDTVIVPPCSSTIRLLTASPKPVPFSLVVKKESKILAVTAGGIPFPVSRISMAASFLRFWASGRVWISTLPGGGENRLPGIVDQVDNDLLQVVRIAPDQKFGIGEKVLDDGHIVECGLALDQQEGILDQVMHIQDFFFFRDHPREAEQLFDESFTAPGVLLDPLQLLQQIPGGPGVPPDNPASAFGWPGSARSAGY